MQSKKINLKDSDVYVELYGELVVVGDRTDGAEVALNPMEFLQVVQIGMGHVIETITRMGDEQAGMPDQGDDITVEITETQAAPPEDWPDEDGDFPEPLPPADP